MINIEKLSDVELDVLSAQYEKLRARCRDLRKAH